MVTGEMFLNRVSLLSVMNKGYTIKPDVNAMPPAVKSWFALATSGVYGLQGRISAALLAANNSDYAALLPQITDVPAPDYAAERKRQQIDHRPQDTGQNSNNPQTLADRITEKSSDGNERINSGGVRYSAKRYNSQRYQNAAYADKSRQPSGLVYLSREAFGKISDALKKMRSVYQNNGNRENVSSLAEYDPFRTISQQSRVLKFPTRESAVRYTPPKSSIDDALEEAA